jgi:RNA polymerase sigma factor for flagellar operon FliA
MRPSAQSEAACSERERLILGHLSQVRLIARRIHHKLPESVCLEDLVSTGTVGLISAIDSFNPAHNVKLRTYAEYKIRGAILDSLRGLDWASRDRRRKAKQIEAAITSAGQRLRRTPAEEEIAGELQLALVEYRDWLVDIRGLTLNSLDYSGEHEHSRKLIDTISDREEHGPSRLLESSELEKLLAEGIEKRSTAERTVLGLYYEGDLTLKEIGVVMHLHPSRISQLKSQAILKLHAYMEKRWPHARGM